MYKVLPFQLSETHVVRYVVVLVSKSACVCVLGCCRSTLPLVTVCALGLKFETRACDIHDCPGFANCRFIWKPQMNYT